MSIQPTDPAAASTERPAATAVLLDKDRRPGGSERRQASGASVASALAMSQLTSLVPGLRWLIGLAIAALLIAGLFYGRELLIPLALAMLLSFLLDPAVSRLKRWGLPRMVATLVVVVITLGALIGLGTYLGRQVQQLSADLPGYQQTIKTKLRNLRTLASGPSAWDGAIKTYDTVEKEMAAATADKNAPKVQKVEVVGQEPKASEQVLAWLGKVSEPVAMTGIVLLFVILILLDRDDLRDRLLRLMGGNLHVATDALDEASERIGKYLRMQFIVNVTYGIPMAAGLWFIGVPGAVLWGVLATLMRFVPYIGPMVSAIFPLALAFAVAPGWDMVLWTLGLILVLELISNNVIEPWLYGSSTGLSTLSIILSATFWTALWGPIGLILSTPLTVCLLVLGRYIPALQFMEVLLGSEPVLDMPQRLYQRLLADDPEEAMDLANGYIEEHLPSKPEEADRTAAVLEFYNDVAVPSLRLACNHHSEVATAEHRLRLSEGMDELLQEMMEAYPPASRLSPDQAAPRVVSVGARWEVDALGAAMVAHSLQLHGQSAVSLEHALGNAVELHELELLGRVDWVVLSVFNAQPQAQVRQICRRLNRRFPSAKVVLALWNAPADLLKEGAAQALGAVSVVNSLQELVLRMDNLLSPEQAAQGYVAADLPEDDAQRVQQLHQSGLLQPEHLPLYRETVVKAANAFNVKYAQVSLVDSDWVHTPGSLLLRRASTEERPGLPREISMCSYVVLDGDNLVVEDVARDPRFSDNPVLSEAQVKFYAGVPLRDKQGQVMGTLCIMHDAPRQIEDEEIELLQQMGQDMLETLRQEPAPPARPAAD